MTFGTLTLSQRINQGSSRQVYQHPQQSGWLVKVARPYSFRQATKLRHFTRTLAADWLPERWSDNARELRGFIQVFDVLADYLPEYQKQLVNTNYGKGLVVEKIVDQDGALSQSLCDYLSHSKALNHSKIDAHLRGQIDQFFSLLQSHKKYFYDFNCGNFIVQKSAEGARLIFTDLKSYRRERTLIPLTKIHPLFARLKMQRRIRKFYRKTLNQPSPFDH